MPRTTLCRALLSSTPRGRSRAAGCRVAGWRSTSAWRPWRSAAAASAAAAAAERERRERLERSLEAEQGKVARLRQELVATEERAQQAEQARQAKLLSLQEELAAAEERAQQAERARQAATVASPAAPMGAPVAGASASVSARDLAWENAGGVSAKDLAWESAAATELPAPLDAAGACQTFERQLSGGTQDWLFEAATSDDVAALKEKLQSEGDAVTAVLRARDGMGRTLLQVALAHGSGEAAKFLLGEGQRWAQRRKYMFQLQGELLERELGRFVNGQDQQGQAALAVLCSHPSPNREVVIMLLEAQADPTQRDASGATPFIQCAKSGSIGLLKLLLNATRGAVLGDADDDNCSALHWAAQEGRSEAVEVLLKAGADADAADVKGQTPAAKARDADHMEVVQMLAEAMSDAALDEFMGGDSPSSKGHMDGDDLAEDGEDTEIPQEDSVQGRINREIPRGPRGSDDMQDSPGGGASRWTSL
mmetsp:Transcript_109672/g.333451  ORF Transcript_109672/g.333451 Transcript_109672/m.333451 type:complete len:481 (-) Transcript_109672:207-1649(-)